MKECCKCKTKKEIIEFNKNQRCCRDCSKSYYHNNRDNHLRNVYKRKSIVQKQARDWIIEYLRNHPCVDCGEQDIVVLELDHLDNKKYNISTMLRNGHLLESIIVEVQKCEIRCCNCHRRKSQRMINSYRVAP